MATRQYKKINKKERKINKIRRKKVKLYEDYKKKEDSLTNSIKTEEENLHMYKVQTYSDIEIRRDIINEAVENNYPEEDVANLELYFKDKKWDINIPDEILDKFTTLEIYNEQSKKNKGFIRRLSERVYIIFSQGGDR